MKKRPLGPETIRIEGSEDNGDDSGPSKKEVKELLLKQASEQWWEFFGALEHTMNAYYGTKEITFTVKPGGWYINLDKLVVNVDPSFFLEKGYTKAEALFASFHEAEHFRDMIQDPPEYESLFARIRTLDHVHRAYPRAVQRLYNCIDDVLVNKAVMSRWKAGKKSKDSLYPKLFPSKNLATRKVRTLGPDGKPTVTEKPSPRHRQFMYALLRKSMLPRESIQLDPEVAQAIEQLEKQLGPAGVELITRVDAQGKARRVPYGDKGKTAHRFAIIQHYIEPIFKEFFLKDLEDRKSDDKKKKGEKGEKGKKDEQGEQSDQPFGEDPFDDAIPDPWDFDDAFDKAQRVNDQVKKKKGEKFKELHGVSKEDMNRYRREKRHVEDHIDELADLWDTIIQKRIEYSKVLGRQPKKQGPLMHPARTASIPAEIKAGNMDVTAFRDFEKKEQIRERPNQFEITLVCDGSSSMTAEGRDRLQRRLAILATESLAVFQDRIDKQKRKGVKINLVVSSEVRIFTSAPQDEVIKPLSTELTHKQRVQVHKRLKRLDSGNNESASFDGIRSEQFNDRRIRALQKGDLKKLIVFLSDGETDGDAVQRHIKHLSELAGPEGSKNLVIAGIGFGGGTSAKQTYAPNGHYADMLSQVPEIFKRIIQEVLDED